MRELGVQNLLASCLNDACRHQALIDVSSYPAETEVLHAMVRLLSKVIGIGIETADMLVRRSCRGIFAIEEQWRATPGSQDHLTRVV